MQGGFLQALHLELSELFPGKTAEKQTDETSPISLLLYLHSVQATSTPLKSGNLL